jgi:hypothetical protein
VIDGHHRLAAYEAADWEDPIPVKMFEGSLEQARIAALEGNHEDKLPMTRVEHPVLFVEALTQINPAFPCAVAEQLETDALKEILEARVEPREIDTDEFPKIPDAAKMADF